jgi:hypothetical protein
MWYSVAQIGIFVFAAAFILPLLGAPDAPKSLRFEAYIQNAQLLRVGNYLMIIPPVFFLLFLGGLYQHFHHQSLNMGGLVLTAMLSGSAMAMLWPFGAVISLLGVDIAASGGDHITAASFDAITPYSLSLSAVPRALFIFALSALVYERFWLSRAGFLVAILSIIGSGVLISPSFLMYSLSSAVLFHVWVFCCSLSLARTAGRKKGIESMRSNDVE